MRPPCVLHSSRSSRTSGKIAAAPATRGTEPATKLSSGGDVSDGLNACVVRRTAVRPGTSRGPKRIVHGTWISLPAAGVTTSRPSAAASPSGLPAVRTRTCTRIVRPDGSDTVDGLTENRSGAAPSCATTTCKDRISRRNDTLRSVTT